MTYIRRGQLKCDGTRAETRFRLSAKRTSPFKSSGGGGRQFSRLLAAEVCAIRGSNAGYTMFRGNVKGTGYPLHSPVSPSLLLPCVTGCHVSTGVYIHTNTLVCFFCYAIQSSATLLVNHPLRVWCDVVCKPPGTCLSSLVNTCLLMSNDFQPYFKHICVCLFVVIAVMGVSY